MDGARGVAAAVLAGALLAAPAGAEKAPSQAGAYCPLPEAGEVPKCLSDAQAQYEGFFLGLERGELDETAAAEVEADLRGPDADRYDALSSLSYGYFTLARQLAATDRPAPELVHRLERWNVLLSEAWAASEGDPRYREALRAAALDLRANVPDLGLRCTDDAGRVTRCASTEAVLEAMDQRRQETGLRGALSRLLQALLPDGGEGADARE